MEKKAVEYKLIAERSELKKQQIRCSEQAQKYARQFYQDDIMIYESSFIMMTDAACNVIAYAKISQGGTLGTVVDTKIVAKYAIESLSRGVIFVHNHPSGALVPSKNDKELSDKMKKSLALFDIILHDSIILGADGGYYSMSDNGDI